MSSGKTDELIKFSHRYLSRRHKNLADKILVDSVKRSDRTPRDRSLNGKDRIRARRARNKSGW